MNIGIDIDDTINKLSDILSKCAIKYNLDNEIEYNVQLDKWDFHEAFGWDEYHIKNFLEKHMRRCFEETGIKDGAKYYINKLKDEGNKIVIITARQEEHCADTYNISKNWLMKNGIKLDKLEVGCTNKVKECKENNIDIFIDDNAENCRAVSKILKIPVYLFDSIYNKSEKDLKRVYTWEEVYMEIKKTKN